MAERTAGKPVATLMGYGERDPDFRDTGPWGLWAYRKKETNDGKSEEDEWES